MRLGRKETLTQFTERAVAATLSGTLIPPMVYIPAGLRKRAARVAVDDSVTINPATDAENNLRIAQADPVGFLIAVMQGQPIPVISITEHEGRVTASTDYRVPDLLLRSEVAHWLADRKVKLKQGDADYDAMIERAANGVQ